MSVQYGQGKLSVFTAVNEAAIQCSVFIVSNGWNAVNAPNARNAPNAVFFTSKTTPPNTMEGVYQQQICKPGSVLSWLTRIISIINLALSLLTGSINLPILTTLIAQDTETSSSASRTYLVFQLLRFTAIPVARKSRELLPHVFTLTPIKSRRFNFLWHWLSPAEGAFPLGSRMLFVARTFLPQPKPQAIERFATAKISFKSGV